MSRARELAKLGNTDALGIDGVDLRAGSVDAGTTLDVASNVNVVGVVTATNFFGEGSGLTGLAAVGSGVTVLRNDNPIGAASKINFDNTFVVSDLASGITTITSGVTTADPRSTTLVVAGISTLQNVTAGVVTANQFSGDISGVAATFTSGITGIATGATEAVNAFGLIGTPNVTIGFNTATKLTTTDLDVTHINVSGISTVVELNASSSMEVLGFVTATNGGLSVNGVTTSTSFVGSLTGNADTATTATNASGLTGTPNISVTNISASGISTFSNFVDINASANIDGNLETQSLYAGITTVAELSATGVATFSSGLEVTSGVSTFTFVSVTGISTFDSVQISSGIVTANAHVDTGIATYYGDGSYTAAGRWTLMASGTDHYVFSGPGLGHSTANDPDLYLKRGFTYMFENKMGAHPFRIQSTTNGATGTQWNVGVTNNDVSNGVLIFEVPFATPDTLYYQCTVHPNMGGVINIS